MRQILLGLLRRLFSKDPYDYLESSQERRQMWVRHETSDSNYSSYNKEGI